jgi:hypothetical protein
VTSTHPSSAEKNLLGAAVASGGFATVICAPIDGPRHTTINRMITARTVRIVLLLFVRHWSEAHESPSLEVAESFESSLR